MEHTPSNSTSVVRTLHEEIERTETLTNKETENGHEVGRFPYCTRPKGSPFCTRKYEKLKK